MSAVADEVRNLDRLLGTIGNIAARQGNVPASEIVADCMRVMGSLRTKPSCDAVNDVLARLRSFERMEGGGPTKAMVLMAQQARATAKSLFDQLAESEYEAAAGSDLDIVFADDIELDLGRVDLVDGLLGTSAMSVVYGESGCGKTFWTLDLACHVAAGLPWRDAAAAQGVVIYIAAESPKSVERRIWAWKQHHGVESLPLAVVRSQVNLRDPNGALLPLIEEVNAISEDRGNIVLIVIDTLSRAIAGADENSAKDMTAFVGNCDRLRSVTGAHVCIVHHTGKDTAKGARGHSSLRAATDTEIEISNGAARVTKQRDVETLGAYGFKLVPVELGKDAQGRTVATCVIEPCDAPASGAEKGRKLGPNEKTVLDALCKTLANGSCAISPGPVPQIGTRIVTHEVLRCAAARLLPHAEPKRKNEAFDRALTSLVGNRHVQHLDGNFWLGLG